MLLWAENRESALFFADVLSISKGKSDFFVIGGAEMYKVFEDLFNKVYLTEVLTGNELRRSPDDAIFDFRIDNRRWQSVESSSFPAGPHDDYPSRFTVFERKTKTVRYVEVENYFTEIQSKKVWLKQQLDLFEYATQSSQHSPINVQYEFELFKEPAAGQS